MSIGTENIFDDINKEGGETTIEENTPQAPVPYIAHEGMLVRMERQIKRLWIALIVAILALIACNIAYLWYLNQYDFVSYEVSSADGGNANFIGNDGDIYNGKSESEETSQEEWQS